ncbi:MAG: insulinase family protein [Eubacterium sp.]|nr:insulinase family protein [Eubacterium sp.]
MFNPDTLSAYTLVEKKELPEYNGTGYLLSHVKTKARVLLIDNDDTNKVFNIIFRTPDMSSKGVQHIIEHTVLCGSKKYPAKDPFIELAKGSLNTFLNAMTYSDKTCYPIASVNAKDYHNLMDVYLDAVFNPNIYKKEEIFKQEGWHYELNDPDDEIIINGVVYNEMKGVYSSADNVAEMYINESLFPDSIYGKDSGGDPDVIPTLTREEYLDFHRNYYHPSNSYIYLYGDVDFEKELNYIDEEYLSGYDYLSVPSEIALQKPFDKPVFVTGEYNIAEDEDEEDAAYLSYNTVIGRTADIYKTTAVDVLIKVLFNEPGAPVRQAVLDAEICDDIDASFDTTLCQPAFSIVAKNASPEDQERFVTIIEDTLKNIVEKGINKKAVEAAVNRFEFTNREAGSGRYPRGLSAGLTGMETWLYDDNAAFDLFNMQPVYDFLRQALSDGYFEKIIKEDILENNHKSFVTVLPKKGINKANEEKLAKEMSVLKASLSEDDIKKLVEDTANLKKYQSEPSPAEDIEKIPMLQLEDIEKKARKFSYKEYKQDGLTLVDTDRFSNGISYLSFNFDISDLDIDDIRVLGFASSLLKEVDTDRFSYNELSSEINMHTGGMSFSVNIRDIFKLNDYRVIFSASFKVLDTKMKEAVSLMSEILLHSHLDDKKRIRENLAESTSYGKTYFVETGHLTGSNRALSYIFPHLAQNQYACDLGAYRWECGLLDELDEKYPALVADINRIFGKIFRKNAMTMNYTGKLSPEEVFEAVKPFTDQLSSENIGDISKAKRVETEVKNEGFKASSKVQYVASAANFKAAGLEFTGALNVLQIILSYDYLWNNVRVLGGAYGAMCGFKRNGEMYFASYRDPNLQNTYEIYHNAYKYVEEFDCSDRDMLKYIIGTIAKIDSPMTPSMEGSHNYMGYENGFTDEMIQKARDQILTCDKYAIRELAKFIKLLSESKAVCTIGNEYKLEECKDLFKTIDSL